MTSERSLLRHRDFRHLWAAETVSQVGTQVTLLALPVVAVTVLDATPLEMGVLTALETAAFLLIGLPAGALGGPLAPQAGAGHRRPGPRRRCSATLPLAYLLDVLTPRPAVRRRRGHRHRHGVLRRRLPELPAHPGRPRPAGRRQREAGGQPRGRPGGRPGRHRCAAAGARRSAARSPWTRCRSSLVRAVHRPDQHAGRRPGPGGAGGRCAPRSPRGSRFVVRHPLLRRIVACTGISNLFGSMNSACWCST